MLRLGSEREKIKVVADQIGSPTYAEDLASAILKIVATISENANNAKFGIYHFSNTGHCSWCDFAKEIMRTGNKNCVVEPISTSEYPMLAQRPQYSLMSTEKIKTDYHVNVPDWKTSLKKCVEELINVE